MHALIELGYQVDWAPSGEAAVEQLEKTTGNFDLVFSDVMMQGMNGIELGQLVRARYAHLPVVLTSGYSEVVAQQGSAGFPLIQKPYSGDALARTLKRALAESSRSPRAFTKESI